MKKYMLLHFGFEKPTPEIMAAWDAHYPGVPAFLASSSIHRAII